MLLINSSFKAVLTVLGLAAVVYACNSGETKKESGNITQVRNEEHDDMVKRGGYLVTGGSCFDCHTPKKMTPQGPVDDSSRMMSGHPANSPLPPLDEKAL